MHLSPYVSGVHTSFFIQLFTLSCILFPAFLVTCNLQTGQLPQEGFTMHTGRMPCILYRDKESPNMHDVSSCFAYICTYYKEVAPAVSRAVSLTAYAHSPALSNHSVLFPTIIFNVIARLYLSFFMIPRPQYVPHNTGAGRSIKR